MNIQSFNFLYKRGAHQGDIAQFGALDQTYFHYRAFLEKSLVMFWALVGSIIRQNLVF